MVHLHLHTSGSELDGACKITSVVNKVIEQGESAVAITDHGNMIKTYEFYKECKAKDIKPIIGCEFYCGEKDDTNRYHLVLLAKNNEGLKNLYKLVHKSYDLFHSKPRISLSLLEKHKEGLICLTACLGGEIARNYKEHEKETLILLQYLEDLFNDDLYLEIQPNSSKEQVEYNMWVQKTSMARNIKPVVTCDCHFVNKEDFESHDTLLCMQVNKKKDDSKRFRFSTKDTYMQSDDEIKSKLTYLNNSFTIQSINSTREIANKCDVSIEYQDLMPKMEEIDNQDKFLGDLCNEGFKRRYKQGAFNGLDIQEVIGRIKYELEVIQKKGYSGYFVIVWDFVNYCMKNGIPTGIGRGSVCGCEIAYLLGITEVEPIRYGLLFERFLNPTRNSPPDIDQDVCYEDRHKVIEYIKNKYGENNTAHIMAEGTLTTKAVIRRVLSAYGYETTVITSYTKLVDDKASNLKEALELSTELSTLLTGQPLKDMIELEGLMSHASKHAAGILIMNDRVDNHFPVRFDREEKVAVCEWTKKAIEKLGGFKFDLLGLKQLTIFAKTLRFVKQNYGIDITLDDLYNIDFEDKRIYDVLNSGNLSTIFQFSKFTASAVVSKIKAECFEDIMVAESICRPGVKEAELYLNNRQHYMESKDFPKPSYYRFIEKIVDKTYGAIVYQEQTMNLFAMSGNFTLGEADALRKVKSLEPYRERFVDGWTKQGITIEEANALFDRFDLGYSFNKSHACAYAKTSAICCYLYALYPKEFIASSLTIELTRQEPNIEGIMREARSLGINILPADINLSTDQFEAIKKGITIPLNLISYVGGSAYDSILLNRPYKDFFDFLGRVPKAKVKKQSVVNLIKAGSFDMFNKNRSDLLDKYFEYRKEENKDKFFYCDEVQIMYERQAYGFSISKHPLDGYVNKALTDFNSGDIVNIIGIIISCNVRKDKKGNDMAFLELENKACSFRGLIFSRDYNKLKLLAKEGNKVSVTGKRDGSSVLINNMGRI